MAASYLFYEMLTCTLHFLCDVNGETQLSPPLTLTLTLSSYLLHYSHASFPERGGGTEVGEAERREVLVTWLPPILSFKCVKE